MQRNEDEALKEAMLYEKAEGDSVRCFLCSHRCHIAEGKQGICAVRLNRGGKLHTLAYGRLISRNVDPIEKKPLYHFLPGTRSYSIATLGCNFQCGFCQNWQISQAPRKGVPPSVGQPATAEEIVDDALRTKCKSIAYTYTEPTIFFEYACEIAKLAHQRGLKNVFVTNGYQTAETIEAMRGVVDAANVDLKGFSEEFYRKLCKARLQPVLEAIKGMFAAGIFIEVTTLVIPGQNDSAEELRGIAEFLSGVSPDMPWHVSAFHPDYEMLDGERTPPETLIKAVEIGKKAGLRYIYAGNLPGTGYEDTLCPSCGKAVIERSGFFVRGKHLRGRKCGHCGAELPLVMD